MRIPFQNGDQVVVVGERLRETEQYDTPPGSAWVRRLSDTCIAHAPERRIKFIDRTAADQTLHLVRESWDDEVAWHDAQWVILLLGLSDTWNCIREGQNRMDPPGFKAALAELLEHHHQLRPDSKFILIGQPFLNSNHDPDWNTGVVLQGLPKYQQAMRGIAEERGHVYVDAQADIDEALQAEGANCFGGDDQHPNQEGSVLLAHSVLRALGAEFPETCQFAAGESVVFIGDSITDTGRREHHLAPHGCGYMRLWHALLAARDPDVWRTLKIVNRGVGGNTIRNLAYRWKVDCLGHRPDHLVVKIGINDLSKWLNKNPGYVSPDEYEEFYTDLLGQVRQQNSDCKITLLSPFYLSRNHNALSYRAKVLDALQQYFAVLKRVASVFDASLVDLQSTFQLQLNHRPPSAFSGRAGKDIIHPSETGCMVIAEALYAAMK